MQSGNKRVFISIPWFSPAFRGGGPIQSILNLVTQMQGLCDFFVFTSDSDHDGSLLAGVQTNSWINFNKSTQVFYASKNNRTGKLRRELIATRPHHVFIIGVFDWTFNIYPMLYSSIPAIISVRGMVHTGARRYKPVKKKIFLALFKILKLHKRHSFHATDDIEAAEVKKVMGETARVFVAENFSREIPFSAKPKEAGKLSMITIALVGPMKNHREVIRALKKVHSPVTYHIYGPIKEQEYWRECNKEINALTQETPVIYHGEIPPALVPDTLAGADIFIMPSRTENFGHAIIEALFAGLPVITSRNVPWLNLESKKAGVNVDVDSDKIAAAIDRFAGMDATEFQNWKRASRQFAESQTNTTGLIKKYLLLFK